MKKKIGKKSLYSEVDGNNINYYSYSTLVAVATPDKLLMTPKKYSLTTSNHCNEIKKMHSNLEVDELKL